MRLVDVNVLIYAHREESPEHEAYARWLTELVTTDADFARFPGLRWSHLLRA